MLHKCLCIFRGHIGIVRMGSGLGQSHLSFSHRDTHFKINVKIYRTLQTMPQYIGSFLTATSSVLSSCTAKIVAFEVKFSFCNHKVDCSVTFGKLNVGLEAFGDSIACMNGSRWVLEKWKVFILVMQM